MLGYGMAESNQFTDTESATCVLAMRQACKNILYTVGNSGYYLGEGGASEGTSDKLTATIVKVDVIVVALVLAVEAVVVLRWVKKRKSAD